HCRLRSQADHARTRQSAKKLADLLTLLFAQAEVVRDVAANLLELNRAGCCKSGACGADHEGCELAFGSFRHHRIRCQAPSRESCELAQVFVRLALASGG